MATTNNMEIESDSEWDLCEDAPNATELNEDKVAKRDSLVSLPKGRFLSKGSKAMGQASESLYTELRTAYPDPKFYPAEKASSDEPYEEGDLIRRTLAEMDFSVSPSSLPKSLLLAISNRFTKDQVERFTADLKRGYNDPLPYFVCGSFLFPAALRAITNGTTLKGLAENMCPATLRGYRRHCVTAAEWPAILPATGPNANDVVIHGMLVFGIQDSQRARIHRFEGGMFDLKRETVQLELKDGSIWNHEAGIYVWNGSQSRIIPVEEKQWSPDMLLKSPWHTRNISLVASEEDELAAAVPNRLSGDWYT